VKIDDYIERCRLARPFLVGTPREIPILAECDLYWWLSLDGHSGDQVLGFFGREDAERAARHEAAGLVDEPRHTQDPIHWQIEHRFDDGVSVLSGLLAGGRWTNTHELFFRENRWVPCLDGDRPDFWDHQLLDGYESELGMTTVARHLNCASVEEARARIEAGRLIRRLENAKGNTLEMALKTPGLTDQIERAISVLDVDKATPADLLAGTFKHLGVYLKRYHKGHSWDRLTERVRALP